MAITLNGTTGITTPDIDTDGLSVDTNAIFVDPATNNVGIGTSSPSTRLHVAQAANTAPELRITAATVYAKVIADDAVEGMMRLDGSNKIGFNVDGTERARIDSSGNLLVGTTASAPSGISENARIVSFAGSAQAGASFFTDQTSKNLIYFARTAFGVTGTISVSGSSTSYNTSSDYRLKENLVPISDALTRVSAIPVYRFNFIADPDKTVDGFVAHELAAHVPEAVTGEKDAVETVEIKDDEGNVTGTEERPVHQGIDQSKLVPLLTAAIQEQQTLIQALTARIEALEQA